MRLGVVVRSIWRDHVWKERVMRFLLITCASLFVMASVAVACGESDEVPRLSDSAPKVISPGPYPQETATSLASDVGDFIQEWVNNLNAAEYRRMWDSYECRSRSVENFLDIVETNGTRMRPVEVSDIRDVAFSGDRAAAVVSVVTANAELHTELVALRLTEAGIKMIGYGRLNAEPCETILFPGSD